MAKKLQGCGSRLLGNNFKTTGIKNCGVGGEAFGLDNDKIIAGAKRERVRNDYSAVLITGLNLTVPNFDTVGGVKKAKEGQAITVKKSHIGFEANFDKTGEISRIEIKLSAG